MTTLAFAAPTVTRASRFADTLRSRASRRSAVSRSSRPVVTSAKSRDGDDAWWASGIFSALLPPRAKEAAREIEYFGGSPLQQILPWVPGPRTDSPGRPFPPDPENQLLLFDFTENSPDADAVAFEKAWGALNDVVMGGRSEASVSLVRLPEAEGGMCAKLSGVVEGDGGGFVSMRSRNFQQSSDLSDYDGVRLDVRGDGRRYKLIARDVEDFFGLAWHASFDTVEGEWLEVDVPFADLKPILRADVVEENTADFRAFRKDRVKSLQLMLSKFELGMGKRNPTFASGPFALEVKRIRAYKNADDPQTRKARGVLEAARGERGEDTPGSTGGSAAR
jgi:hypothetical protein